MKIVNTFVRWLRNKIGFDEYFKIVSVQSFNPKSVKDKVLYVVGENGYQWYFILKCPCGCGAKIYLNCQEDVHPRWEMTVKKKRPSLSPSIWRLKGCKSHFWLNSGRIVWYRELEENYDNT